jgi:hypothetical protein
MKMALSGHSFKSHSSPERGFYKLLNHKKKDTNARQGERTVNAQSSRSLQAAISWSGALCKLSVVRGGDRTAWTASPEDWDGLYNMGSLQGDLLGSEASPALAEAQTASGPFLPLHFLLGTVKDNPWCVCMGLVFLARNSMGPETFHGNVPHCPESQLSSEMKGSEGNRYKKEV